MSGPLVRTVRSRAPPSAAASRMTVDDASKATAPVPGPARRAWRRSATSPGPRRRGARRTAAARRRWRRPARGGRCPRSSSSARSRRIVISLTPSASAAAAIVTSRRRRAARSATAAAPRRRACPARCSCAPPRPCDGMRVIMVDIASLDPSLDPAVRSCDSSHVLTSRSEHDHLRRHRTDARAPGDRAAVVGVRQLRHPLQGVRPAGRAARPVREDRRRRAGAPAHRAGAVGRAAHPVGPGRRLRQAAPPRRGPRRAARHDQHEHVPGRRLQARQPVPRRRAGPGQGDRPHARVRRHHGRHRQPRPQGLAARRHSTTRARATCATARTAWPTRCAQVYARLGDAPAAGARVQVLRAGVLRDRRARLGHVVRALRRARRAGRRVPRHRPPRARHEHRVHRHAAAAARPARRVRLQLPLLRRRRPDRRRRRPVPAVPHPVRGRARRRLRRRAATSLHARPVPQHRGEDPRPDPLGAQRAGDDGAGAARRPRRAGRRRAGRRRARPATAC